MGASEPFDAIILAGGAARRFGGADKPGALVGGRALIAGVAAAVAGAEKLIVVGPERPGVDALYVQEDPPGAGPVPALRAGMAVVTAPRVVLLAADLPFITEKHVDGLLEHDNAVLVDASGKDQWLTGAWLSEPLRAVLAEYQGARLFEVLAPLHPVRIPVADDWFDCDTPEDLARARAIAEETPDG